MEFNWRRLGDNTEGMAEIIQIYPFVAISAVIVRIDDTSSQATAKVHTAAGVRTYDYGVHTLGGPQSLDYRTIVENWLHVSVIAAILEE